MKILYKMINKNKYIARNKQIISNDIIINQVNNTKENYMSRY